VSLDPAIAPLVGAMAIVAGGGLRWLAVIELREAGLTNDHFFLCEPGHRYTHRWPYSVLAHPCYVGSLLMLAGAGMIFLSWGGAAIALAAWPYYEERIRYERRMRDDARKAAVHGA